LQSNIYQSAFYTDEHLKWDKPPMAVCLWRFAYLTDLSVTVALKSLVGQPLVVPL